MVRSHVTKIRQSPKSVTSILDVTKDVMKSVTSILDVTLDVTGVNTTRIRFSVISIRIIPF